MPIITKLGFQKNQKRANVHLDGQFTFGLATAVVLKEGLKKNQKLTEAKIRQLIIASWREDLYEQAVNFLSLRPRSRKEITDYLHKCLYKLRRRQKSKIFEFKEVFKDVKDTLIEEITARLNKNRLLNDEEFARWFVRQRLRLKPKGKKFLGLELKQKGVEQSTINRVLSDRQLYSQKKEVQKARQVAEKAYRQLQALLKKDQGKNVLKRRLYQRLASRGFDYELIRTIVDDLLLKQ